MSNILYADSSWLEMFKQIAQEYPQILQAIKVVSVEGKVWTYHMGGEASTMDYTKAIAEKLRENVGAGRKKVESET